MSSGAVQRYIVAHWRGQQGLAWSFFVNLVGVRAAIFVLQEIAKPAQYEDYHDWAPAVLIAAFVLHGIVFVWQAVGVIRAGEAHIVDHGSIALHWGGQLGILIAFWFTASYSLQAWQMTIDIPDHRTFAATMEAERASKYLVSVQPDGVLSIKGTLELGATRRLAAMLAQDTEIREIILSSEGGNIYEARGLSRLFRENRLATTVTDKCLSACTTAFIGGQKRQLKSGAKLGFHQYRIAAEYHVLGADPGAEERKDQKLFLDAGVTREFVSRMHSATPGSMWYPETKDLLDAGVITQISD